MYQSHKLTLTLRRAEGKNETPLGQDEHLNPITLNSFPP